MLYWMDFMYIINVCHKGQKICLGLLIKITMYTTKN